MARASFAGTRIPRGLAAGRGILRQAALLPSHVVMVLVLRFLELAPAEDPSGLLVWPLLTSSSSLPA
jgi:hypothetical protein